MLYSSLFDQNEGTIILLLPLSYSFGLAAYMKQERSAIVEMVVFENEFEVLDGYGEMDLAVEPVGWAGFVVFEEVVDLEKISNKGVN